MKIKQVVIPVGGLGTRFLPFTKAVPKEMIPVANKPLIQYAVEEALDAGIEKIIFITGRNKSCIENHFDVNYELNCRLKEFDKWEKYNGIINRFIPPIGSILYTRQTCPKGLGHAILCARYALTPNEPFAVLLPDELMYNKSENFNGLKELINYYDNNTLEANNSSIIGLKEVNENEINKYGIAEGEDDKNSKAFRITKILEKPNIGDTTSRLSAVGRYIFSFDILDELEDNLDKALNSNKELQLTDSIDSLIKRNKKVIGVKMDCKRFDCGSLEGYISANVYYSVTDNSIKKEFIIDLLNSIN